MDGTRMFRKHFGNNPLPDSYTLPLFLKWQSRMNPVEELYVPRLSHYRGGEPVTFYHMHDIKGRHDLTAGEWTKLGAHTRPTTSVFKTTTVFFSGKYDFSALPSFCSQ